MIRATFPATALTAAVGDHPAGRTIAGVAVPYGVPGVVASGETVIFEPGSLDPNDRPIALRDHDRARPIGRLVDAADRGDRLEATVQASRTRDGDEALILAADGVLMFSVGADPTDWSHDADGVLHVRAARWDEISLLTFGAYAAARISTVTATQGAHPMNPTTTPTADPSARPAEQLFDAATPEEPDTPAGDDDGDEEDGDEQTEPSGELVQAARGPRPTPRRVQGDMDIRRMSAILAGAYSGRFPADQAHRMIRGALQQSARVTAALADVTLVGTTNVGTVQRPSYQAELVEIVNWGRPTIEAIRRGTLERGDYPNKTFNRWTTGPTVGLQAAEKDEITSTPVDIDPASAPVQTWAGGNDISQQILDFGSPSFVEDYIRAAAVDYARKSDTYAVTTLLAAAEVVPPGADFVANVAALLGSLDPTAVPPGRIFLALSWDQGVGLAGVKRDDGPAFWSGTVDMANFMPDQSMGGMNVFVDPNMPANTLLMGLQNGATWYEQAGTPASLRVNDVALLGLDVAVYGYGALGVQYPGAFSKMTIVAGP